MFRYILSQILDEVLGEDTLICNLLNAVQKYLVGPISVFQQFDMLNNIHALSAGHHALVPNFNLPPGWTWAQIPGVTTIPPSHFHDFVAEDEVVEETEKPTERIPRPPNPFIIYRAAHHKAIADANPEASNNEICEYILVSLPRLSDFVSRIAADSATAKMIGRQWQSESEEVRETYRSKAADIKAAFMVEHPNYKYSPRKSCEVKRRTKKSVLTMHETVSHSIQQKN